MKKYILFIIIAVLLSTLCSCTAATDYFGFTKEDFKVVDEKDSHGGFHGDGAYYLILNCSENKQKASELIEDWKPLAMSEPLELIMYGGEKNGISYDGYNLSEQAKMPEVENGYYCFYDRHPNAKDPHNDSDLLKRASFNFSLAVYDTDSDIMYYFEYDT